jgi:hypothetical protein
MSEQSVVVIVAILAIVAIVALGNGRSFKGRGPLGIEFHTEGDDAPARRSDRVESATSSNRE